MTFTWLIRRILHGEEGGLSSGNWCIEDLFKHLRCFFNELGTVCFQEVFVFEFLQSFGCAHVAIKQLPTYNGTVSGLEPVDELNDQTVGFLFCLVIGGFSLAILEPYCHHGTGHDTTCFAHAGHSSTKGTGYLQCLLPVEAKFLAKRGQNSLSSAKGLSETFYGLCRLIHNCFLF